MNPKQPPQNQMCFPIMADLIATGGGNYILKPRLPDQSGDSWLTIKAAAPAISPNMGWRNVHRLKDEGYLVFRKVMKKKVEISLKGITAYKQATSNVLFFEDKKLQKDFKAEVAKEMAKLQQDSKPTATPLQKR